MAPFDSRWAESTRCLRNPAWVGLTRSRARPPAGGLPRSRADPAGGAGQPASGLRTCLLLPPAACSRLSPRRNPHQLLTHLSRFYLLNVGSPSPRS